MQKKIMVINGPNLNMLGLREPEIYGKTTYKELEDYIYKESKNIGVDVEIFQSNYEGEIVEFIHNAYYKKFDGIVINPAAYTHYSIAILDAIKAVNIPTVEIHISDIEKREEFRKHSVTKDACIYQISGLGIEGYIKAIQYLVSNIS